MNGVVTPWAKQYVVRRPPEEAYLRAGYLPHDRYGWTRYPAHARKFASVADAMSHLAAGLGREPGEHEYLVVPFAHPEEPPREHQCRHRAEGVPAGPADPRNNGVAHLPGG